MATLPSIQQLNHETSENFIEVVNTLFETAPPLADRLLAARPFQSYFQLIDYAQKICLSNELSYNDKLDIINAHPRIGAGKANLSAASLKEQGYNTRQGALSKEDEAINEKLAQVNKQYEDKYGHKFVVFVAGRPRAAIIPLIEERIAANNPEQEMKTGMVDMMRIARDRLIKASVNSKL
ncbi:Oxo-4-hydroxy-4-carboxy-5-ureidoimidazoline decarboxylase [Radiomyces spectabilis]|uniref:Oxo-4-hydroxy-4-carboxy-5-ureidoimidazoline decarboxylase n=1 Tax=Radiomyces spectabilis TaxID=64574 RepID=UPI00221E78D2|nr:Oxo-4-hydroxy-4-carboxy-5-ureidoimidazoline decarboxylase [Radiomyces spectabilis]KAI8390881.1 Oxo-4-hydroxy-4-carboxy-5-ureidoimidazoline decarboxylase [Radiomyces spectabilis]